MKRLLGEALRCTLDACALAFHAQASTAEG
jgi:hypothetical protein